MIASKKSSIKKIVAIVLIALLLASSIFSVTFAYFSDKHDNFININVAKMQTEVTTQELDSSDLLAGNIFSKSLTYSLTGYDVYFRVYAITKMQTYDSNKTNVIERTDLIDLINVSNSRSGIDNKYYYVGSGATPISVKSGTYTLNFTFKVSNLVNEELFTNSEFTLNTNLKTTITYYFEYCQVSGWDDWNNYVNANSPSYNYKLNAQTKQNSTPTQTTPQTLNNAGDLITEENKSFYNANQSQVGKYALPVSVGANDNLVDISKLVDNSALVSNTDGTYTLSIASSSDRSSKETTCYYPAGNYIASINVIESTISAQTAYIVIAAKYTDNTYNWFGITPTLGYDSSTNRYYRTVTFKNDVVGIYIMISNSETLGTYTTFKDFKIERGETLTPYLPYGYGKNLFNYEIAYDTKDDTRPDGFTCNLTEGLTYRLTYNTSKGNLNWFKISNSDQGHNCNWYGNTSSNTPITSSGVYNGFVFTFTRNANISATANLYIWLRINGESVNTLNYYLAEELDIKLELVYNAPAGKNIFTSSILDYRSNNNSFVYNENSQTFTINKTNTSNALSVSIYKLANPIPVGTSATLKIFVLSGSLTTQTTGLTIGGYHKVDGDSNSWQGFYQSSNLNAGDIVQQSMTTTNTMTDFWFFMPNSAYCENLVVQVMLELCTKAESSLSYISYKPSGTTYIYLNEPLRSTSNVNKTQVYADEIDLKRGVVVRRTNSIILTGDTNLDGLNYGVWPAQKGETTIVGRVYGLDILGRYDTSQPNNGGLYLEKVGSCSHFALSSSSVYNVSDITGFSVIPQAHHPYVAFRFESTTNTSEGFANFFKEQYEAGTPVELILAYYGEPKYDTVNIPLSLSASDEELNLYSICGTFSIN